LILLLGFKKSFNDQELENALNESEIKLNKLFNDNNKLKEENEKFMNLLFKIYKQIKVFKYFN
jgi:hypothetical protein